MAETVRRRGVELPRNVYLVKVDGEWPIDVVAEDGGAERLAERLDEIVKNRSMSAGGAGRKCVRVFRARIGDFEEVEVVPARRVGPELRPIEADGP